nr:nucleotidyltransferase domain-containing protein [uncultured Blautia sp.]
MNDIGINPKVIREIRDIAEQYGIRKVLLFGSRARGDFKRTSDIDIAVTGGDFERFALDVNEETSTLLEYDIVNLDREMQDELRESIEKEGVVLYEKI